MAKLFGISSITPQRLTSATLTVETRGFTDITRDAGNFLRDAAAGDGVLLLYLRHTSASLVIQDNADPDVQDDLMTAMARLTPEHAGWVHDTEGPDDMPGHIKAMLNGVSLNVPVTGVKAALGTWQGIYLVEHREAPHRREIVLQFIGGQK